MMVGPLEGGPYFCALSQRVNGADWRWSSATHDSMRSSDCCRLRAAGGTGFFSKNARMSVARAVPGGG